MKNPFARFFRKEEPEDWRLVQTFHVGWKQTSKITGNVTDSGKVFVHMFESEKGNRHVRLVSPEVWPELAEEKITAENHPRVLSRIRNHSVTKSYATFSDRNIMEFALTCDAWNETVYPWLCGRFDPDIPSYESIPRKEFRDQLAGKKVP